MKSSLDCIPCIVSHILHVARMVTPDEGEQKTIMQRTFAEVANANFETTPPELAREFHKIIRQVTGVHDPYQEVKDASTRAAVRLMPLMRQEIAAADDKFEAIVRLVIGGNIIDFGADKDFDLNTAHHRIVEALSLPVDSEAVKTLHQAMDKAENILYIADNCGEAVFDRLLIELYADKITLGVRGGPILNDITRREIEASGLDKLARKVVDTGDTTPGVSLTYSSPEFLEEMKSADLIVAKGQGNFETLNDYDGPIVFLLRVKCAIIADMLEEVEMGSLQVIPCNLGDA